MNYWQVGSGAGDRDYSQEFLDDYLQDATRPDLEFHADYEDREIVFWAFEAHVKRFGGPKLPEFDHRVEFALRAEDLYVHDYHPDALRYTWGREGRSGT